MATHPVSGGGLSTIANMSAHQKAASAQAAASSQTAKSSAASSDEGSKVTAAKASPSVNMQGQEVGRIVNTTA